MACRSALLANVSQLAAENQAAASSLRHTLAQADGRQGAAREMLSVLEEVSGAGGLSARARADHGQSIVGLEPDAETEAQMRAAVEALLAELGPRKAGGAPP